MERKCLGEMLLSINTLIFFFGSAKGTLAVSLDCVSELDFTLPFLVRMATPPQQSPCLENL